MNCEAFCSKKSIAMCTEFGMHCVCGDKQCPLPNILIQFEHPKIDKDSYVNLNSHDHLWERIRTKT